MSAIPQDAIDEARNAIQRDIALVRDAQGALNRAIAQYNTTCQYHGRELLGRLGLQVGDEVILTWSDGRTKTGLLVAASAKRPLDWVNGVDSNTVGIQVDVRLKLASRHYGKKVVTAIIWQPARPRGARIVRAGQTPEGTHG
jgi:hypothetical protein